MLANDNNPSISAVLHPLLPLHQHPLNCIHKIKIMMLFLSICDDSPLIGEITSFLSISQLIRLGTLSKYTHKLLKYQHVERRILKTKLNFFEKKKAFPYQLDELPLLLSKYWMPMSSTITQSKPIYIKKVKTKKEHTSMGAKIKNLAIIHLYRKIIHNTKQKDELCRGNQNEKFTGNRCSDQI